MYNCFKIFRNERLYAITANEARAEYLIDLLQNISGKIEWRIEGAFIDGIGF